MYTFNENKITYMRAINGSIHCPTCLTKSYYDKCKMRRAFKIHLGH